LRLATNEKRAKKNASGKKKKCGNYLKLWAEQSFQTKRVREKAGEDQRNKYRYERDKSRSRVGPGEWAGTRVMEGFTMRRSQCSVGKLGDKVMMENRGDVGEEKTVGQMKNRENQRLKCRGK